MVKIRTWVTGTNVTSQGFTLLEMILVLLIATFMIGIVGPRLVNLMPGVELKSFAQRYTAVLRQAGSRAIAQGETISVTYDQQASAIIASDKGEVLVLPADITLSSSVEGLTQSPFHNPDTRESVQFYADGSSNGATIRLSSAQGSYRVHINWLNSRVSIDD
ncbi:GspH/FimT family pseudopilin [uncultured Amphritea sp.]|uniref:GspH/FimT family pseudopilin n=1 Tax=uncultured Amphritea sp. TaxID=981605 RepID=UPI0025EBB6DE|nr:GspH/FimT family pseudopilin [uncultured Amphritea sp.]